MTTVNCAAGGNHQLFERLQVHSLWQRGFTGAGVAVGHLDTGLDSRHPALQHQPFAFRHFDRAGLATNAVEPFDVAAHGTHMAGMICGRLVDGVEVGIAPDCTLYSGVVLEQGDIISRILFGMAWIMECKVRVLCLPLGIPGYTPVFASMIRLLRQHGVLIIAPIGNLGAGRSLSPGDYHGVLSVGAVDREGMVTTFSGSYHPYCQQTCMKPDVLAPGADILVARPGGGYQEVSGTSIACALVAGIAALLMQAAPSAPLSLIEDALVNTSMPLPLHKIHRSRRGLIQPEAALHYVLANQTRLQLSTTDYNSESSSYNPLVRSYKYIDPRLQKIFRYASNDYILEAVFIIASTAEVADNQDPRGAAGEVIDRVTRAQGEKPERIRYIAAANIAIVLAKAAYLRMLIDDPQVQVTSATDIDKFLV